MIVEQKGRDVWRGRHKSVNDAVEAGVAGIGVDKILATRATKHEVQIVMVVIEEMRRVFLAPIEALSNEELAVSRTNWQGRSTRIVGYSHWHQKYLGPSLRTKRKRASAC